MTDDHSSRGLAAAGLGAVVFVAFAIVGLGAVTFFTGAEVIEAPVGPVAGPLAVAVATAAWIGVIVPVLRRRPGLAIALLSGFVAAVAYVATLFVATIGAGVATAGSVVSHAILAGFAVAILIAGILAGVGAAVVMRAGPDRPKWPWEREDDREP